jgi:hypothetical protein
LPVRNIDERTSRRGRYLRLIEALPSTKRTDLLPAPAGRTVVKVPAVEISAASPLVLVPPPRPVGNGPFLAQYLDQDADPSDFGGQPDAAVWRQRDAAYRLAALPPQTAEINIEI